MACRGFWECLLRILNFLLLLVGLAMIGYGIYLFVEYKNGVSPAHDDGPIAPSSGEFVQLGRPLLLAVSLGDSILDKLPKAWFIYLFTGVGVVVLFIACCGCLGASTRNGCCLSCYSVLVILLILAELGAAGFLFFDKRWQEEIPTDKTGNFEMIYHFLEKHWKIVKWVALGAVILEALVFLLALVVRAANTPADYDSDDEYIGGRRQQIRQPLINRPPVPATGVPVAPSLDHRPSRTDAWSTRMREKYGLDTSEFTYNPSGSNGYQQAATQSSEEKGGCIIM
ncbi:hypothetical protein ACJIZ3_003847 [Penstemon smallii]|uniref:Tobamovirus multiplication protein 2A n=1 Tax=Penstemon smallii TaxID=265156 RepID=A0ABD3S0G1_9LAMI